MILCPGRASEGPHPAIAISVLHLGRLAWRRDLVILDQFLELLKGLWGSSPVSRISVRTDGSWMIVATLRPRAYRSCSSHTLMRLPA